MLNQQIGPYKIISELGEGGMAMVYLAEKGALGKQVALKVLKKEFIYNQHFRSRFLSEAKKMINLNHSNIVGVHDLIDDGDFIAIELEYIDGKTLKQHLNEKGALPDEEIERLFKQMLDAVGYIHEKGYIHRDIKPSNFMLTQSEIIKLTDFGIAKNIFDVNSDYTQTYAGMLLGTPKYMSPEQFQSTKDVDHRSDIYSLGVVLWEMVTGKVPYDLQAESTIATISRKIEDEQLEPTITRWDRIIQKCTNKNIEYRYQKVDEIKIEKIEETISEDLSDNTDEVLTSTNGNIDSTDKKKSNSFFNKYDIAFLLIIFLGLIAVVIRSGMSSNDELDSGVNSWEEQKMKRAGNSDFEKQDSKQQIELENEDFDEVNSNETADFDAFKDNRDGKVYNTVQIGDQVWMAENLAYEPSSGNYWAYDDDPSNVAKYGYLYDWETACKVCPDGWHLPRDREWKELIDFLGGSNVIGAIDATLKMKSLTGWSNNENGNNISGFSALPAGFYFDDKNLNGEIELGNDVLKISDFLKNGFNNIGSFTGWWCSNNKNEKSAKVVKIWYSGGVHIDILNDRSDGYSIRCLKDQQ